MLDESANKFTQQFNLAAFWKWEEHYWERFDTFIEKYKIQKFQFFYFYILFFFFFDSNHSNHQSIVTMKWNDVEMVLCVFFFSFLIWIIHLWHLRLSHSNESNRQLDRFLPLHRSVLSFNQERKYFLCYGHKKNCHLNTQYSVRIYWLPSFWGLLNNGYRNCIGSFRWFYCI